LAQAIARSCCSLISNSPVVAKMTLAVLKFCNVIAFAADMVLNARAGKGIKDLSEAYDHVGMPAGPAFAIWGIIFTWELVFLVSQFFVSDFDDLLPTLTPWFCATQLMQGVWVALFTKTDAATVGHGGDVWLWTSTVLLVCTPAAFLQIVFALKDTSGTAYWLSFGMTINAAWVLLAAGLSVNQAARAVGLQGAVLSAVALFVLAVTVFLEIWITGLVGDSRLGSPLAYFPVATWALFWIYTNLKADASDHAKRILPMYGSNFIQLYKWSACFLAVGFGVLEAMLIAKVK